MFNNIRRLLTSQVKRIYHNFVPYEKRINYWSYRQRRVRSIKQFMQANNIRNILQNRSKLKDIIAQHHNAKGIVLLLPSVEWHTQLFQRPHQMALAFAKLGYLVLYWVHVDSIDKIQNFEFIQDNLYLCNVSPAVMGVIPSPITISYTYNFTWSERLRNPKIVYELIDHFEIFSNFPMPLLEHNHRKLLKSANVVIGTADDLVSFLLPDRSDAILCPNGVDIDHFTNVHQTSVQSIPLDMVKILADRKPVIGYYGALAEWFDYEMLKYAAQELPDYHFVLIGPDYDTSLQKANITSMANVYWLGPKKYVELPDYLRLFDVATIPFIVSDALNAVSPIKLFEYMAGERPIVTTDLIECRKYSCVLVAQSHQEFVSQLKIAVLLRNDTNYLTLLRQTAKANTWQARAEVIVQALTK